MTDSPLFRRRVTDVSTPGNEVPEAGARVPGVRYRRRASSTAVFTPGPLDSTARFLSRWWRRRLVALGLDPIVTQGSALRLVTQDGKVIIANNL